MEGLFPVILFIVIFGISALSKWAEKQKRDSQQTERKRVRPEDLPEATRRMLYGDTRPTEQPRPQAGPVKARPVGQGTRSAQPVFRETAAPRTARPVQPTMQPQHKTRERVREWAQEFRGQVQENLREAFPEVAQELEKARQQQQQQQRVAAERHQQAKELAEEKRRAAIERKRREQQAAQAQRQAQQQRRRRAPAQRRAVCHRALFGQLADVRRGIVMSEILGTPKGLQ